VSALPAASRERWSRSIARAYGLRLLLNDATDIPPSDDDQIEAGAFLRVNLDATPDWAGAEGPSLRFQHPQLDRNGVPLLHWHEFGRGRHAIRYADQCHFFLETGARTLWARWPDALTGEDAATYLLGPVLGFCLRLFGNVCLHASVVMLGNRCVAFAGPAGSGKSTLAAALAMLGEPVLTEDVACLDEISGEFSVRPGYPLIRLWESSEKLLPQGGTTLPLLTPNWDKRYLPLDNDPGRFHDNPEPLAAIYLLRKREPMEPPARISALTGQEALSHLIANTHANYLLDREMQTREFDLLGRLARTVPVRALTLNADGSRLMEAAQWLRRQAAT